jgi:hypothetical protein
MKARKVADIFGPQVPATPLLRAGGVSGNMMAIRSLLPGRPVMSMNRRFLPLVLVAGALALLAGTAPAQDPCLHNPSKDFGEYRVGTHVYGSFRVTNESDDPIEVNPQLAEPHDQFGLPLQQTVIQPGEYHRFEIVFYPSVRGYHEALVTLGSPLCADMLVTGTALAHSCLVTPEPLDLGVLAVGESTTQWLTVTNDGDMPLDLVPSTLTEGAAVSSNPLHLEIGETGQVEIQFSPRRPLSFAGVIDWGITWPGECDAARFSGAAYVDMEPGQDHVGLFFDPDYTDLMPNTTEPFAVVTGYLVLTEPSSGAGVAAWELAARATDGGVILDWEIQGDYVNIGAGDELIVGLGPGGLPSTGDVLLATCRILVPDPASQVAVELGPVATPTVPGLMSWIPADGSDEPRVMLPFTNVPEVAWFNLDAPPDPSPVPEPRVVAPFARLLGNAPNPFNPSTEIRFETVRPGDARVAVYDLQGRLVRPLVDEYRRAGTHTAVWDGRDAAGRAAASGAYYVRLETRDGSDLLKIMLLK